MAIKTVTPSFFPLSFPLISCGHAAGFLHRSCSLPRPCIEAHRRHIRSPPPTPGLMPSPLPCAPAHVLILVSRLLGTTNRARQARRWTAASVHPARPPQAPPGYGVATVGLLAWRGTRRYLPRILGPSPASSPFELCRQTPASDATPAEQHRGELFPSLCRQIWIGRLR